MHNILQPHNITKNSCSNNQYQDCQSNNEHFLLGRGRIVTEFVSKTDDQHNIVNYNKRLLEDCTKYSAFNFVSIEIG